MNINIRKAFALAMVLVTVLFASSCKDKLTLDEAGDDIFITMTPRYPNLQLKLGEEPIKMSCIVQNHDGKVIPTEVKWTSDNPEIAKFIDGTNQLVAVSTDKGTEVLIRATLPNGRYAVTRARIGRWKVKDLSVFAAPLLADIKKVDTKEGEEEKYAVKEFKYLADDNYLVPGGELKFLVKAEPAGLLMQDELSFEAKGLTKGDFTIKEITFDPSTDFGKKYISITPKGAKWFSLKTKKDATIQNEEVTIKFPAEKGKFWTKKFKVSTGTVLSRLTFLQFADKFNSSAFVDVNKQTEVSVFVEFSPERNEDVEFVKNNLKWEFSKEGVCTLTKVDYDPSRKSFTAHLTAGAKAGKTSLICSLQGKKIECSISVVDIQTIEFEKFEVSDVYKDGLQDLYVGETKPLRITILPKSSTVFLLKNIKSEVVDKSVATVKYGNGAFSVTGLKAGQTELVLSLRGQEMRLPIKTKAAVKAVNIDNTSSNIAMIGDVLDWRADVTMEGTDKPDFSKLIWTSADTNLVAIQGKAEGESVKLKALKLADGQEKAEVMVKASYRGKASERKFVIVPLQSSTTIKPENLDLNEAGVTLDGAKIKVPLTPKASAKAKESLELEIKAKSGATSIEAKTYTAQNYNIYIIWNNAQGVRKLALDGSSVKFEKVGSKYNLTLNLSTKVGDKTIELKGTAQNLEEY